MATDLDRRVEELASRQLNHFSVQQVLLLNGNRDDVKHRVSTGRWQHSRRGVLRGLHYQIRSPQGKLVSVVAGEVFDVAVDLRRASPNFGRWVGVHLSAADHRQVWVPPGFAHGYYVLSDWAEVTYKTTDYYSPEHERTLLWDDPGLGVDWPLVAGEKPLISSKDARGLRLKEAELYD